MKVAVIGGGIAGLSAAWRLQGHGCQVELFEQEDRLGGHTDTHAINVAQGSVQIDTGFIVFNELNYPQFSQWLSELNVRSQPSHMSFAVRDERSGLEYGTGDLQAILANRRQALRPDFWRLWWDLTRFYKSLRSGPIPDCSVGDYLSAEGYGRAFIDSHIVPMCAALWSQPMSQSLQLSLRHVVEFMRNHRMLQVSARPSWRVVQGGSSCYVDAFAQSFSGVVHLGAEVSTIQRTASQVFVGNASSEDKVFDAAILACHSDQALAALSMPTAVEQAVLGAIAYQPNQIYLHSDTTFMPRHRDCWSSWNVTRGQDDEYTITYWMNELQGLTCTESFFVTLNPPRVPKEVHWQGAYAHPQFTQQSYAAQQRWSEISAGRIQYAGAYWGAGFHEDGFVSGIRAADQLLQSELSRAA